MSHRSAISATRPSAVNQTYTSPVMKQDREHFMHHIRQGNDLTFWLNAHSSVRLSNINVYSVSKITLCSVATQRDKDRGFFVFFSVILSQIEQKKRPFEGEVSAKEFKYLGFITKGRQSCSHCISAGAYLGSPSLWWKDRSRALFF